jgi:hypothetical protein
MTWIKTVAPVDRNALKRDAEGRVVCDRCGAAYGEWSPQPGATWYRCDVCGKTVLGVDMLETSEVRV